MSKKSLIIRLVLSIFVIPLGVSFLANLLGFVNPGLFAGLTLIAGVVYFILWVKGDRKNHNEQPTDNSP